MLFLFEAKRAVRHWFHQSNWCQSVHVSIVGGGSGWDLALDRPLPLSHYSANSSWAASTPIIISIQTSPVSVFSQHGDFLPKSTTHGWGAFKEQKIPLRSALHRGKCVKSMSWIFHTEHSNSIPYPLFQKPWEVQIPFWWENDWNGHRPIPLATIWARCLFSFPPLDILLWPFDKS